jgi:5,10-methylene-tetrahydrofolate dehydrogenase/methenyl tetrahydrofolate cyclohydrolase
MDEEKILGAISLEKDVDGFHPLNVGNLALRAGRPLFIPCAAKACLQLLLWHQIDLMGKHAVVIGRSKVVGLPTSLLLQVSIYCPFFSLNLHNICADLANNFVFWNNSRQSEA